MTGTLLLAAGALAGILLAFALATWLSLRHVGRGGPAARVAAATSRARARRPRREPERTAAADSLPAPAPQLHSAE